MKLRCLAIDDEPVALEKLKKYIENVPFFELTASCRGVHDAAALISSNSIDVMFIDINMPDANGLEFVKGLENPPMVVFCTAYSEYAVESYKVRAVDYILKPYDFDDFQKVADNVLAKWNLTVQSQSESGFIYLKTGTKITRAELSDIVYIEGMNEYLKIHPVNGDSYLTYATFKSLRNFLPDNFQQVHRSYVVNMEYVHEIEKSLVKLKDGTTIPIGGNYKDSFHQYVRKNLVQK